MNRKIISRFCVVIFLLGAWSPHIPAQVTEMSFRERQIDFTFFYPGIFIESAQVKRRQKVAAGVGLSYQYYFNGTLGIVLYPWVWFTPIRFDGKKTMIYSTGAQAGMSLRLAPFNYFDPTVFALGGIGYTDERSKLKGSTIFPTTALASISLYRDTNRFRDSNLALVAFGGYSYVFDQLPLISQSMYHAGLAFRGSF